MVRPKRILITGARAPVALHLCRLLAHDATQVFLADTYDVPLAQASNRHSGYIKLPPPRYDLHDYAQALADAVSKHQIDLIIPTCEEVFYLAILAQRDLLTAPMLAPDLNLLTTVHNKFAFMELAKNFGLATPDTRLIETVDDLVSIDARGRVFKPVWSRFASDVLINPSVQVLRKITPTPRSPWVAQAFVTGDELSVYAVARRGHPVTCAIYKSVFRAGKGAGVCFERINDAAVQDWMFAFLEKSGWDGQVSFDMIRQTDGSILPLECNPRATSGLHFYHDAAAFSAALWGGAPIAPDVDGLQAVRLALWIYGLPQAIRTGRLMAFRDALKQAGEILDWPDDHGPVKAQFRALREIARIALRQRISLQQASTRDIEWNGPDQT